MNTTGLTQLTTSESRDQLPAVSPNGNRIAFTSDLDGDTEIFVMKANTPESATNKPIKLTKNTFFETNPDWSPDGRRIVFVSNRDGDEEVWRMRSDGTNPVNLTDNTAFDFRPSWQPIP